MKNFKRRFSLLMIILFAITLWPISDYKIYAATLSNTKLITQVSLSETKSTLAVGDIEELMATVYPSKTASQIVKWTSSNSKVATVSSVDRVSISGNKYNAGKVKALSKGTTIITATAADGSKKATCAITVIPSVEVKSVELSQTSTTLAVGAYDYLESTVYPNDATDQEIQWTTSNSKIATVSSNGKVTALSAGTATIKGTTSNKKTASCVVTVTKATAVILNKNTATLAVGGYDYLSATVYPNNGTNRDVKWTSSNPSVATISSRGQVSGVRAGVATITATTADGNKKAICTVKVTSPISVTSVTLNTTNKTLTVGDYDSLSAAVYPIAATNKKVKWTSSNSNVATVSSNGNINALSVGTAIITVTTENGSKKATCTIKVNPPVAVTSVVLNKPIDTLTVGQDSWLSATVYPKNATNKYVEWISSNPSVAIVSNNGEVTALKMGTATITAATADGNKKASCVVTVKAPISVTSVALDKIKATLTVGGSEYLSTTIYPSNASNKDIEWKSSNPAVAVVSPYGEVTALKIGTATITATTVNGSKKVNCVVTVKAPVKVTSVALNKTKDTLTVGDYASLDANVYPINATNQKVEWVSSNPAVAKVSYYGQITAVSAGTTTITAITEDGNKKSSCVVTVKAPVAVTSIQLNQIKSTLTVGEYTSLDATVKPSNAANKNVKWTSSNPAIATVTSYGSVTAVSAGTATITATTTDGNKKANCIVTVKAPVKVTSVALNKIGDTLIVGGYTYLDTNISPINATNQNVEWTSSNSDVATVTSYGSVTAVSAGTATITVTTADGNKKSSCVITVKAPVAVTSVALNKGSSTLTVGDYTSLNATVKPSNAANQNIKWTSSNPAIATVTSYGEVKAVSAGTATITATTTDGNKKASCVVTVKEPVKVTSVELNKIGDTLTVGGDTYLEANVYPINAANQNVEWTSSNTTVATVTSYGSVTAVSAGTATITVTTADGNKKASCVITVKAPVAVTSVELNQINSTLTVGDYAYLDATVKPSNAANRNVKWTSSNPAIATVTSYGSVTAVSAGTATITATTTDGNKKANCIVTVKAPVAVTSVGLNKITDTLTVGGYDYLSATVYPSNAANKEIEWTSSNSAVATVSSNGKVTAVGAGTATITVTTADGSKTKTCTIKVAAPVAVTSIVLNKTKATLTVGDYDYLGAIINPTNAANKDVEWTSSNLDVAVVNYYGEVIALGKGTATITATTLDGNKKATCVVTVN